MINFNPEPTTSTPELTSEIAQAIYTLIKTHGDADKAYKLKGNSDYEPEHFTQTANEIERLFNEMNRYASGSVVLEAGTPATYNEEGEIETEAVEPVYFTPTTETNFKEQFSSDLLDVNIVYTDWKGDRTWTEIKTNE